MQQQYILHKAKNQKIEATCLSVELSNVTKSWKVIENELNQFQCTAIALGNNVDKTSIKFLHRQDVQISAC